MSEVLAVAGPIAVAVAWVLVRTRRLSIWTAMAPALAVIGVLALSTGRLDEGSHFDTVGLVILGLGSGVALYVATAAFVVVAERWPVLGRQTTRLYEQRAGLAIGAALTLGIISAVGEELLWRGLVQEELGGSGDGTAAVLAWLAYVAANAFSGTIPVIMAAAVGGVVWGALTFWTNGILAAVLCHALWTGLMIARPPLPKRA